MIYTHILFKCPACGYTYQENFNDFEGKWEVVKGDEEFIFVDGVSGTRDEWGGMKTFDLLMCPKCKNIRGE